MSKKNNQIISGVDNSILFIVAVVGAGILFYYNSPKPSPVTPPTFQDPSPAVPPTTGGGGGGGGSTPTPTPSIIYWCYQESPNSTNQTGLDGDCDLKYTGSLTTSNASLWTEGFTGLNDGNWSSYDYGVTEADPWAEVSIMYYKPDNATSASKWQIKGSDFIGNLSIPDSCWDYQENYIVFTIVSRTNETAGVYSAYQCYNGDSYPVLKSFSGGEAPDNLTNAFVYEEAMWWAFDYDFTIVEEDEGPD